MPEAAEPVAGPPVAAVSTDSRFVLPLTPAARQVRLLDFHDQELGRWQLGGGTELVVDLLDPVLLRVDGRVPDGPGVPDGFVPYPRTTLVIDGDRHELVSGHPAVLQRHYNRPVHAAVYWGGQERLDPYVAAFHKGRLAQIRRLMRGVGGRVLDVGSGHTLLHHAGLRGIDIVACDRDRDPVRWMVDNRIARAVVGAADGVPFAAGSFDAVFAGEIVEHLVEPHQAVRRWVELLRPGGRLVITTPNREHVMARLLDRRRVVNVEHLFEWSSAELLDAVGRAGARVVRHEGLVQAIPVPIPGRGWRDAVYGLQRRRSRQLPEWLLRLHVELGRPFPAAAQNMAVAAIRE